ncbi:hypothetical protein quinque_012646 [Culex quinquefasciatus]
MKFLCVFCLLALSAVVAMTVTQNEVSCRDQEGASDVDVEMFQALQTPETKTTKCYYSCIMQYLGFHDGQRFDNEGFLVTMLAAAKTEQVRQNMRRLAEQCDGMENDDPCELAADIVECIKR